MSERIYHAYKKERLVNPCPLCGAKAGEPCKTKARAYNNFTSKPMATIHRQR